MASKTLVSFERDKFFIKSWIILFTIFSLHRVCEMLLLSSINKLHFLLFCKWTFSLDKLKVSAECWMKESCSWAFWCWRCCDDFIETLGSVQDIVANWNCFQQNADSNRLPMRLGCYLLFIAQLTINLPSESAAKEFFFDTHLDLLKLKLNLKIFGLFYT